MTETYSSEDIVSTDLSSSDLMELGSVTRARPGDANAPDRVSDFGPAAVDRLVEQRAERRKQSTDAGDGLLDGGDGTGLLIGVAAALVLAALAGRGGA